MKTAFFVFASIGFSIASAAEQLPKERLQYYLTSKTELGSVFAQGTLDGVDYRNLLRGAVAKDSKSLSGIFRYTANGRLMGVGADSNCEILRQLLRFWGDSAYARVLGAESPKVRHAVISALDDAWDYPGWQPKDFPLTYSLAKHDMRYRK